MAQGRRSLSQDTLGRIDQKSNRLRQYQQRAELHSVYQTLDHFLDQTVQTHRSLSTRTVSDELTSFLGMKEKRKHNRLT